MKRIVALFISVFVFSNIFCQKSSPFRQIKNDSVYIIADSAPKFTEGGIYLWLGEHIVYPKSAIIKSEQGNVFVSFIIEKDGSVSTIKLLRGVDNDLNKEALNGIAEMPAWKPAKMGDDEVRMKLTLPVKFELIDHVDSNKIYTIVEQKPVFPKNMNVWIAEHTDYPSGAKDDDAEGTVYVEFIVEKNGKVTNAEVLKGVHPDLDKEAVTIVSNMPKWIPGSINGQPVRVQCMLAIPFSLHNDPTVIRMN